MLSIIHVEMGVPIDRGLTRNDGFEPSYVLAAKHEIQRITPVDRRLQPCPLPNRATDPQ